MDRLTKEQRYKNMSANKGEGTKLEILFGKLLWNAGVRYRRNDKTVFGKPDFVIRKMRIAIFCDGEFWHGRNWEKRKNDHKSNCEFWHSKIERNIERDKEVNEHLNTLGWKVFRFWETEITKEPDKCLNRILNLDYITLFTGHGRPSDKQEQNKNIPKWIDYLTKKGEQNLCQR